MALLNKRLARSNISHVGGSQPHGAWGPFGYRRPDTPAELGSTRVSAGHKAGRPGLGLPLVFLLDVTRSPGYAPEPPPSAATVAASLSGTVSIRLCFAFSFASTTAASKSPFSMIAEAL